MKTVALLVAFVLVFAGTVSARAASEARKVAVVVGANRAPPGRAQLRYAHEDATRVSEVLVSVAGFLASNVKLLLEPEPDAVLAALDLELARAGKRAEETLLFFYYSGHADQGALFPSGKTLAFSALKTRLEDRRAKLRVGLLDSCSGGSWTGSKGLKKVEPFEVDATFQLAEEGSVLIASSSGQENAHETEALRGSFFTHYWNAGLRGAADRGGDGVITLNEAFEYARTLTIRDTALTGHEPQHPSFQMRLSGRRDFALATLGNQRTSLAYDQATGPTEVVRLIDGLVVVETSAGPRRVQLGLPAGSYLVRRRDASGQVYGRIVVLHAGGATTLSESELDRSTTGIGRAKGAYGLEFDGSWAGQRAFAAMAMGIRHAPVIDPGLRLGDADGNGVYLVRAAIRIGAGFWWAAPLALSFDAESDAPFNWFAWAGLPVFSVARPRGEDYVFSSVVGFGFDARYRYNERHSFSATLAELGAFEWGSSPPDTFATQLTLGISETLPGVATFNLGVGVAANLIVDGEFWSAADSAERQTVVSFGSVQRIGLRPLPLIHVPVGGGFGIDVYAVAAYLPARSGWVETYLAGVSYGF